MESNQEIDVMFQDEVRFGTLTTICRTWKTKGIDYEVKTKMGRENFYTFGSVSPVTGELISQDYEKANTDNMQAFLEFVSSQTLDRHILMIIDKASWHTTGKLIVPSNITLHFLPPTSPQLNPIERLWKYIKTRHYHNIIHDNIQQVKANISQGIKELTQTIIASICRCSYLEGYL